jgi:pimeloyl-ACP methyl ester carboxylesterase
MNVLVNDLLRTLDELKIAKAHFFGHAFGNRLCRTLAATHPDRVLKLGVFASGGNFEMTDEQIESLRGSLHLALTNKARLEHIRRAFFAAGSDPAIWLDGWYPQLAAAQIAAARGIDPEVYKKTGGKPFLLIQATEDFIAPPDQAGKALKDQLGDQVTYVEIDHAGHAMTSEQPDAIAKIVIEYLKKNSAED